jgi:hypothetical protein
MGCWEVNISDLPENALSAMPVECLNSCQTNSSAKKAYFSILCTGNMLQKAFGSKQFVKH